jgi:hypothetical protein
MAVPICLARPEALGRGKGGEGAGGNKRRRVQSDRESCLSEGGEAGRWGLRVGDAHVEELLRGGLHACGRIGTVLSAGLKDLETRVE